MNIGDNIKKSNDLYVYTIFNNLITVLEKLRKVDKKSFNLEQTNLNNNVINNKDYTIKIFNIKINNFKKNGLLSFYNLNKNKKIIFIVESISIKLFTEILQFYENVEIFLIEDLFYDISNNILQPKYELLSKEEKNSFQKNYNINNLNLIPKIKKSDIIVRFFNAKVNDILKITRFDSKFGKDIYYRLVIDSNYDDIFI